MVKCPRCGTECSNHTKEWDYSAYNVKNFDCTNCKKSFNAYYVKDQFSHTIPRKKIDSKQ